MKILKNVKKSLIITLFSGVALHVQATTVQFQTSLGDIEVNLYDETTPKTVANFLHYVSEEAYSGTIVHRVAPKFVVQGGGFVLSDDKVNKIPTVASPVNEPIYANVKGTIAMAKLGGDASSATNQWFFNLSDNSANLDFQNGGFTVFGEVVKGMDVVEAIAALDRYSLVGTAVADLFADATIRGAFDSTPLRDYIDAASLLATPADHLMLIQAVVVLDADPATASALSPKLNTNKPKKKKKSGSIDISVLGLFLGLLGFMGRGRAKKHAI